LDIKYPLYLTIYNSKLFVLVDIYIFNSQQSYKSRKRVFKIFVSGGKHKIKNNIRVPKFYLYEIDK